MINKQFVLYKYSQLLLLLILRKNLVRGFQIDETTYNIQRFGRQLQQEQKCNPFSNQNCEKYYKDDYPSPLLSNHTCEDYKKKERGDETHVIRTIKPRWLEERALGKNLVRKYAGFYHVNGTRSGQEFLLCAIPKNGVSRAKLLVMRINGLRGGIHDQNMYQYVHNFPEEQRKKILSNPNIPRIKLVRNPYIRAISMYKDKIIANNRQENGYYVGWHMKFKKIPNFDEWVAQLYKNFQYHQYIDEHFSTQYEQCWENIGLKFDYILKIERMDFWYPCFVENLNLWQYVMRGWPDADHCYLSTSDAPCNGPVQNEHGKLVYNSGQSDGIGKGHNHDSFKVLREFYKNETTARLVTEIYLNDIVQYNYPFWYEMTWTQYNEIH